MPLSKDYTISSDALCFSFCLTQIHSTGRRWPKAIYHEVSDLDLS